MPQCWIGIDEAHLMIRITEGEDTETLRWAAAEKLGWRNTEYSLAGLFIGHPPGHKVLKVIPSYAVDIKAAWQIVDHLAQQHIRVSVTYDAIPGYGRAYRVVIGPERNPAAVAMHPKPAIAVCLAFLNAPEEILRSLAVNKTITTGDTV